MSSWWWCDDAMTDLSIRRAYVRTRSGVVHVAECGAGAAVLLFHQTPRSWAEFRAVLPLLGRQGRAIAMDTRGFGDSDPLDGPPSVEAWAGAALDLADALGLDRFAVCGHHTGAYVALECAAQAADRVTALAVSGMNFVDADNRAARAGKLVVDEVERQPDGTHLAALWQRRQPNYPADRPDLLEAFVLDALKAGPMAAEGHRVVGRYQMEDRVGMIRCPALVMAAMADQHSFPGARRVAVAIPHAELVEVPGAMVPFPDQMPEEFAAIVTHFLASAQPN